MRKSILFGFLAWSFTVCFAACSSQSVEQDPSTIIQVPSKLLSRTPPSDSAVPVSAVASRVIQRDAKNFGSEIVVGAIVCMDYETSRLLEDLWVQAIVARFEDKVTNGQSVLQRGSPPDFPRVSDYGCIEVHPGTPMMLEAGNSVPVVDVRIGDLWARGVTTLNDFVMGSVPAGKPNSPTNLPRDGLRRIGGPVQAPVVTSAPEPKFSEEARRAKVSGSVLVYLEVGKDGLPSNVRLLRGIGMGLDEKAVEAVKQYKFKPATENGTPVPVQMNVEVTFTSPQRFRE